MVSMVKTHGVAVRFTAEDASAQISTISSRW
jgi:hypothetical protein